MCVGRTVTATFLTGNPSMRNDFPVEWLRFSTDLRADGANDGVTERIMQEINQPVNEKRGSGRTWNRFSHYLRRNGREN